eukprot:CAMPEP_0201556538 /NCGR_PEP_ID=MMETSP0173_2-20130828/56030_1 /ASSEMBLY_ACC=CAM_ASM_000268 /TAXON_ID=218659 /ORGANISM="Vexillifera sp., Strain DIVA3 564/2" /LENGTH=215 /DNA_ID=CAMNT_0047968861 /DNA_START=65 /DNA_END=709 /DNA_ORIENTATION=-
MPLAQPPLRYASSHFDTAGASISPANATMLSQNLREAMLGQYCQNVVSLHTKPCLFSNYMCSTQFQTPTPRVALFQREWASSSLMQLSLAISYRLYIDPDGDVVSSFYHNHLKHLNFIRETNKRQLKQLHLYTVVSESQKPNILASATLLDSESVQEFFLHNIDDENLSTSPLFPPIAGQQQRKCLCEKVFSPNETHSINEMRVLNMPALKQRVW